jgi:hypothetical protein
MRNEHCFWETKSLQNFNLRLRDHNSTVGGFQGIIAHRAGSRESNVNDGSPALQFVVSVTMKKIRGANGNTGGARLDERKPGVIIDGIVGQKYFLAAAAPHVQGGEIVQSAGCGDSRE